MYYSLVYISQTMDVLNNESDYNYSKLLRKYLLYYILYNVFLFIYQITLKGLESYTELPNG